MEIMDGCFWVYRRCFGLLLAITCILQLPFYCVVSLVQQFVDPFVAQFLIIGLSLLGAFLVFPLCFGAVVSASAGFLSGESIGIKAAYKDALRNYWKLFGANFLALSSQSLGYLFCFVPGLCLHASFFLFCPAILFEGRGVIGGLRRSAQLVASDFMQTVGIVFIIEYLLVGAISLTALSPHLVMQIVNQMAGRIPGNEPGVPVWYHLLEVLIFPLRGVLVTLVYLNFRMRKEGLDLEGEARRILPKALYPRCSSCGIILLPREIYCSVCGVKNGATL